MDLYIDKEYLISFIKMKKDSKWKDCNRLLKHKINILAGFPKDDIGDDMEEAFRYWLSTLTEDCKTEQHFGYSFPSNLLENKSNSYKRFSKKQLSSIFMMAGIDKLRSSGVLLSPELGDEENTLGQLWFDDMQFMTEIFDELNSWNDLKPYALPCTDIIISDPYIFKDGLFEYNAVEIINVLCSRNNGNGKVSVVVFTRQHGDYNIDESIKEFRSLLKNKGLNISVTVVKEPHHYSPRIKKEHDRSIFTNYRLFDSGDSFSYFNTQQEKQTNGRYFHVMSNVDNKCYEKSIKFVGQMQEIINEVSMLNPNNISGDKDSNFLKFPTP